MPTEEILQKRWTVQETDDEAAKVLQESLRIHPILCRLLVQRGIKTFEQARTYFRPSLDDLHDPYLMKDMVQAVKRLETALDNKEKILIYGDYDVDGTTSVALVYNFLKDFYSDIDYYIPDRYKEGYGISKQGIDHAADNGFSLIIALDCGIKANDKVQYATGRGVDFIICDHHNPGSELPAAVAVLDPKRADCKYPYKELSGCGVGFKLIQAFAERNEIPFDEVAKQLDLVAVSIASDIVPVTGENRILAYYGLQRINTQPRPGLRSLIEGAGLKKELQIDDLVFKIGPRINAAGRMGHARNAVALLISEGGFDADFGAETLNDRNAERRQADKEITDEALAMIAESEELRNAYTSVLYQPHWHKGVVGIVASRLIEKYHRPTIVFTENDGKLTGSARSVTNFDVYEAIMACDDLIEQWGGHKYAAGLTILPENLEPFRQRFEQVVRDTIDPQLLTPEIEIDAELDLTDVTPKFYKILRQFGPFGPGNMRPVFRSKGVRDGGNSKIVGETHLKLHLTQDGRWFVDGIAFGMAPFYNDICRKVDASRAFELCYCLSENEWNNRISIQMDVKDIKL